MKYKSACLVILFSSLLSIIATPLVALGGLPAEEVRSLFSGQTVEGERSEGADSYTGPSALDGFSEPFVMYFSEDGSVRSIRNEIKKSGKWWVDEEGNHCVRWKKAKKDSCAPITKEGRVYKKYKKSKFGSIKWVKTFTKFRPGNPDNM